VFAHRLCAESGLAASGAALHQNVGQSLAAATALIVCIEKTVASALATSGLDPQYLELEITETGLMQDMELTFQTLLDIRKSRRVDID